MMARQVCASLTVQVLFLQLYFTQGKPAFDFLNFSIFCKTHKKLFFAHANIG